jgi:hypothetical protein
VGWNKRAKKYQALIMDNGKHIWLGYYDTLEVAEKAVKEAREKLHGEYARHK